MLSAAGEIDIEIPCKKCKYMNRFKMRIIPYEKKIGYGYIVSKKKGGIAPLMQ